MANQSKEQNITSKSDHVELCFSIEKLLNNNKYADTWLVSIKALYQLGLIDNNILTILFPSGNNIVFKKPLPIEKITEIVNKFKLMPMQ